MVGNEVAYFATVHFLMTVVLESFISNVTAFQRLHFSSLRIMKHTITPYNVLLDVGAVSDS